MHLPAENIINSGNTAFVLVYDKLCHGGIETMILRLSKKIRESGAYVCLVCKKGGDLDAAINIYADIFYQQSTADISDVSLRILEKTTQCQSIIMISFDVGASTRAVYLEQLLAEKISIKNITGIFHPRAYFMPCQPADRVFLNRITLLLYGARNTFFMNAECKLSHAKKFGLDYGFSPIIILPVIDDTNHEPTYSPRMAPGSALKVLSVGRIVPFKAYNRGAPAILKSLFSAGVDAEWDIYGYGPDEAEVDAAARELGVSDQLSLRGLLPYGELPSIINRYDVFVGMGTAVLEAAALGLPSICAIVDQKDRSYGFVHELPVGNVGETISGRSMLSIADLLIRYSELTAGAKSELMRKSVAYCGNYSVDGFLMSILSMANSAKVVKKSLPRLAISWLILEVAEGWLGRLIFGSGIKAKLKRIF